MNFFRSSIALTMLLWCAVAHADIPPPPTPPTNTESANAAGSGAAAQGKLEQTPVRKESRKEQILREMREENLPVHRAAKMELKTFLPAILVISVATVLGLLITAYLKARHPFGRTPRGRAMPTAAPPPTKEPAPALLKGTRQV